MNSTMLGTECCLYYYPSDWHLLYSILLCLFVLMLPFLDPRALPVGVESLAGSPHTCCCNYSNFSYPNLYKLI